MTYSPSKTKVIAMVLLAGVVPLTASVAAHFMMGDATHILETLHEGFELTGTCVALSVAMLMLLRMGHENTTPHLLWVVAALVAMGIVDGIHSLLPFGAAFSWTRHGATLVGGVLFALVWLPLPAVVIRRKGCFIFAVAVLAIAGALAMWWWPERLPAPWVAGNYSHSVMSINMLGGVGFLAAALFFIRRYLRETQAEDLVFASQTLLFGVASLFFGFSHVWATDWWIWHAARLIAYLVVLVVAYDTVATLYLLLARHAQELNDRVHERTLELATANTALRETVLQCKTVSEQLRVHQIELELQNEELRAAQVELDAARARYFDLYDQAPVGYVTLNDKGLILEANLTAASLLDRTRSTMIKQPLTQFIFKEDQDIYYLHRKQLLATNTPQVFELRVLKKEGQACWVRLDATVTQDAGGMPVYRVTLSDITKLKRTEEDLLLFKTVVEHSSEACAISDATGRLIYINPAHEQLFGRLLKEAQALNYRDYYPPESVNVLNQQVIPLLERGESWMGELDVLDAAGRQFSLWERADSILDSRSNKLLYCFGFMHDTSERKRLDAQHRQLHKAESLGRMAGAIAHHFNNHLQAVMGNLELAIQDLPRGTESFRIMVDAMHAAQQAAEVSRLMLTYLGQTPGSHAVLDLSKICRQNTPILCAGMPKNMVVEMRLFATGPAISANANQIQQVLANLLNNACEAIAAADGVIHLAVTTVAAADIPTAHRFPIGGQLQDQEYACLTVTDTGSGIANHDIEKLFDPFYSTKFTGRGLGLPVVLGIVRAHGGVITVASELGHGSSFRVFLPLAPASADAAMPATAGAEAGMAANQTPAGTVLVVEDDEAVRKVAAGMLARLGFTVLAAPDGVAALEVFQQRQADICCVLCDLAMPRMDGWATLTALRQLAPDLPVILASGYDEAQVMAGEHPELPQAFLGKPYQMQALRVALEKALAK